jgi:hypothetical protein
VSKDDMETTAPSRAGQYLQEWRKRIHVIQPLRVAQVLDAILGRVNGGYKPLGTLTDESNGIRVKEVVSSSMVEEHAHLKGMVITQIRHVRIDS